MPEETRNKNSNITTNIDENSVLESWVTGEEEWFNANGVTPMVAAIKQLSGLLTLTGASYGKTPSFVKPDGDQTYMNLVYVSMLSGSDVILGGADIDGKVNVGETTVLNQNDGENMLVDAYVNAIKAASGQVPPVFQSSAGGTCFGNPGPEGAGVYALDPATQAPCAPDASCFDGEYITLYYDGMAILLEYMN